MLYIERIDKNFFLLLSYIARFARFEIRNIRYCILTVSSRNNILKIFCDLSYAVERDGLLNWLLDVARLRVPVARTIASDREEARHCKIRPRRPPFYSRYRKENGDPRHPSRARVHSTLLVWLRFEFALVSFSLPVPIHLVMLEK